MTNLQRCREGPGLYRIPGTDCIIDITLIYSRIVTVCVRPGERARITMPGSRAWLSVLSVSCAPNADYIPPERRISGALGKRLGVVSGSVGKVAMEFYSAPVLAAMDLHRFAPALMADALGRFAVAQERIAAAMESGDALSLAVQRDKVASIDSMAVDIGIVLHPRARWAVNRKDGSLFVRRVACDLDVLPVEVTLVVIEANACDGDSEDIAVTYEDDVDDRPAHS